MTKAFDYDIELDELRLEEDPVLRDNTLAILRSLQKIQTIINDMDERLNAGGL